MKIILNLLVVIFLTTLTQVGGIIWLLSLPVLQRIRRASRWQQKGLRGAIFLLIYGVTAFVIVPPLAQLAGRTPLPCFASDTNPLQAANVGYCLLMRNYVTPATKAHLLTVAQQFRLEHPNSTVRYLDANFPFLNSFPLLPHLSHNDGRKVDLAYFYQHKTTQQPINFSPSWLGYWHYEQPHHPNEAACNSKSSYLRWDFNWLQPWYAAYAVDMERTHTLLALLAMDAQKILLEPHLQKRLGVHAANVKFQGCRAARHDDHIHAQW